jgi:hypothetical protein
MTSELRNIYHTLWSRFKELIVCYDRWKPIPHVLHKQFRSLVEEYETLALKSFREEYDALKLQYEHAHRLYREAEETLEDCLASCPDTLRWNLNENIKRCVKTCNNLMGKMHKSEERYQNELERIHTLLPKCPHCEEIEEEELEQMRLDYYNDTYCDSQCNSYEHDDDR